MDEYLTVKEVAALVKLSEQTVRTYVAQGLLPGVRVGRRIRIPRDGLERALKPVESHRDYFDLSEAKGELTSADDPLWRIVGIGESTGPTDVSVRKHDYLAEVYEDLHE